MMHATPLDGCQFGGLSYELSHAPCAAISYDCYDAFDIDSCSLLGRPHRLEALAAFNKDIYLQSLL